MPKYANFSLAADTVPVLKRSLSRARTGASKQVTPMELDDYLRSTEGSPYQHYRFDP
jgi:hypothetical protein